MARSFSYKGAGTVKTGTYGTPKNGGYIKVTGASFNERQRRFIEKLMEVGKWEKIVKEARLWQI